VCFYLLSKKRKTKRKKAKKRENILKHGNICDIITNRGGKVKHIYYWYKCPNCGNPKMFAVRDDTKLVNFPGYCKKCKTESIITTEPKRRIMNS